MTEALQNRPKEEIKITSLVKKAHEEECGHRGGGSFEWGSGAHGAVKIRRELDFPLTWKFRIIESEIGRDLS